MEPLSGDKIRQMIDAARRTIEFDTLRKDADMQMAALFNQEKKLKIIESLNQLYAYQNSNGPRPILMPSEAFNPYEGSEKTNLYFLFKELRKGMPWEVRLDYLITPFALSLVALDIANQYFPSPVVSRAIITAEGLTNLIALPKFRPGITEMEDRSMREHYMGRLSDYEELSYETYGDLSVYFASIEDPMKDPVRHKICETNRRTMHIHAKVCGRDHQASSTAKGLAFKLWNEYRNSPQVAALKKGKGKTSYADVFAYFRRQLVECGIPDARAFKNAVRSLQKMRKEEKK